MLEKANRRGRVGAVVGAEGLAVAAVVAEVGEVADLVLLGHRDRLSRLRHEPAALRPQLHHRHRARGQHEGLARERMVEVQCDRVAAQIQVNEYRRLNDPEPVANGMGRRINTIMQTCFFALSGVLPKEEAIRQIKKAIEKNKDLYVLGKPDMSLIAFTSDTVDIFEVADELGILGWYFERMQKPEAIHLTISQIHHDVVDDFIPDLNKAVKKAKSF